MLPTVLWCVGGAVSVTEIQFRINKLICKAGKKKKFKSVRDERSLNNLNKQSALVLFL